MPPIPGVPHPFPYQGSKRQLASQIVSLVPEGSSRLVELFAGSAAVSIACASSKRSRRFLLNDSHAALVELWRAILDRPEALSDEYEELWHQQLGDERAFFDVVRERFNRSHEPACLLYLLARCVKAAIRYNASGEFNNSPDNRRKGMRPLTMRRNILHTSRLLHGKTTLSCRDYRDLLSSIRSTDIVYMDPPYQGVCKDRDSRYHEGILFEEFVDFLGALNTKDTQFIVSYDGRTGERAYGAPLPSRLGLSHVEIAVGRSAQETLLGRDAITYESLYVSAGLADSLAALERPELILFGQQ